MIDIGNKFIHAEEIDKIQGKPAFAILNNKSGIEIACVAYYPAWKRYVMLTDAPSAFDVGCLRSIIDFINQKEVK